MHGGGIVSDSFVMTIPDLRNWQAELQRFPKTLDAELYRSARVVAFQGEGLSKQYVKRGPTGNLANTIYSDAKLQSDGVIAIFGASAAYAINVEEGRRAGAKMPPQGALLPWMAAVGIPEEAEFVVRRAIARKGIPPAPFISKAFAQMQASGFIVQQFESAVDRALQKLGGQA
jgi:hypothetical protein